MNLSIGIVGLPNVGKSTLFNALLKKQQALVANYPFATIEPNVGVVAVPDDRLIKLQEITMESIPSTSLRVSPPPIIPATVRFVDIAGLVKGASEGAGLGNKFLSHIREVSVIAHVVRAFENPDVLWYQDEKEARLPAPERSDGEQGSVGVREDYETVNTELALADLQSLQNQESRIKNNDPKKAILQKLITEMNKEISARKIDLTGEEKEAIRDLFLLTAKSEIIVLNVEELDYKSEKIQSITEQYSKLLEVSSQKLVVISAKIESELASLSDEEQKEYLRDLGLEKSGLERLIQKAYEELGLISFLTCGEKEVKAWTVRFGSTSLTAAGEIHTDFTRKFIKAEVVSYADFVEFGGWKGSREHGRARLEGREYVVRDGDIIEFKIGT
ncbi:MAG: hypothetical protein A2186_04170 [Candidatus Levybacteria bacterium RIFOXYA1_FULL_41_10]|nr:MAG: GTP-binding protein YchF [Candidatus Levybacteria bacterium GW2011_GWC2_40_7]KKR94657.1 MAG: GTP-binding protein YchF [Candidatus Levybacteria bacterium GW2011_GWA2_41_15]OGH26973.1 MAG: hypothetical protein A3D82_02640 [Candidatus Levybacteria bacterium RIFCSPHIGHO2_02_FULL_40_29]OGH49932.1 MAG: hypothetical protein A3J18_03450 [Candidatus Levybacteria bacterium RIFCSPLOWO2_02_FULL_40_18]OGH52066.1 MAG: hypothetical protein A3H20_03695 [Candidatus Levybacteria bacterium RIFCSPLOWO2_12_